MAQQETYVTAETEHGRQAIQEVMRGSYDAALDEVPADWALARVVDGAPVSFIVVDPRREMAFPRGKMRYAFICDVATRQARRGEGHFRALMEHVFDRLRDAGIPWVLTHGRYQLYRRFGFDVFTYHCGVWIMPDQITFALGNETAAEARQLLTVEAHPGVLKDLLLVPEVKAQTLAESRAALVAAAAAARELGKAHILFEHPPAPSYGSLYPLYTSLETPFLALARACGAQVCIQGAAPEGAPVPDADWIKVLDAAALVREVLGVVGGAGDILPEHTVCLDTDAGAVTMGVVEGKPAVLPAGSTAYPPHEVEMVRWPSSALAQLVTGYCTPEMLNLLHGTAFSPQALALLGALQAPGWRLSRNESWTYVS